MNFKNLTLDVGCGFENYHKKHGNVGVDLFKGKCDVVADIRFLPFRRNVFSGCYAFNILEHFGNPLKVLSEIHFVTECNGFLKISIPKKCKENVFLRFFARLLNVDFKGVYIRMFKWNSVFNHKVEFSVEGIRRVLNGNGFEVVSLKCKFNRVVTRRVLKRFCKGVVGFPDLIVECKVI